MSATVNRALIIGVLTGIIMNKPETATGQEKHDSAAPAARAVQQQHRVHTSERFTFVANARPADVFPLLGANKERVWAPGWEPRFLWPASSDDQPGMVFQIARDGKLATWVNTVFDSVAGRVQYVYVLPDVVATLITIQLQAQGDHTEVVVVYERTSLSPEADAWVKNIAQQDHSAGPEWASQINGYLSANPHRG